MSPVREGDAACCVRWIKELRVRPVSGGGCLFFFENIQVQFVVCSGDYDMSAVRNNFV